MLLITLSRLGLSSSSMLPYIVVALSFSPPPPLISSKQVHSSSSFELTTCDPKVHIDFFFSGEVTGSILNLSFGVGSYVHVFN